MSIDATESRSFRLFILLVAVSGLLSACGGSEDGGILEESGLPDESYAVIACPEISVNSGAARELRGGDEDFEIGEGGLSEKIDDAHRFREVFMTLNPNSQENVPEIDFHREQVLMVAYGLAPNLGYETVVERIAGDDDIVQVDYLTAIPGLSCVADDAVGYPYCLVSIEATEREIAFVGREEVRDCD